MKTLFGFGDLILIFKVTVEQNRSNLSIGGKGHLLYLKTIQVTCHLKVCNRQISHDSHPQIFCRHLAGQNAYQMASEKPDILEVLNNPPPDITVPDIDTEIDKKPVQRTISENSLG